MLSGEFLAKKLDESKYGQRQDVKDALHSLAVADPLGIYFCLVDVEPDAELTAKEHTATLRFPDVVAGVVRIMDVLLNFVLLHQC